MNNIKITKEEFQKRIDNLKQTMCNDSIDAIFVYGDEYRKENLRYVSNFWPIFEQGALVCSAYGQPILLCAPEGEQVAREMSAWEDVRLVPDFLCVTVPDVIEFPQATFTSFRDIADELNRVKPLEKLAVVGIDAMSVDLLSAITSAFGCEVVDYNPVLTQMRIIKSEDEVACLRKAAEIAEIGFKAMMESDLIGKTERWAAGIAEGAARQAGAEAVIFTVFGSGERSAKIIGRAENKIIDDGDMIMCAFAVQYEGYVATCEIPFAIGNYSDETKNVIDTLIRAGAAGLPFLRAGLPMKSFVSAIRNYFRNAGVSKYDLYPPLHGIGCAEAESPYPNEETDAVFEVGMTVSTDISLFGLSGGSNRVEEAFVITEEGAESLSPFTRSYFDKWLNQS